MKNLILAIVLLTFFTGCMEKGEPYPVDVNNLIFQSEYTNYAWGYNHNGWMMDNTGKASSFQKSAPWVFPDSLGYISEVDMQKNLSVCDAVVTQISSAEFSTYAGKARNCLNGTLTKPENKMADAGEHIWAFYYYEPGGKRYKRVILDMTGDWSQHNLAVNAAEIVEWMMKIK